MKLKYYGLIALIVFIIFLALNDVEMENILLTSKENLKNKQQIRTTECPICTANPKTEKTVCPKCVQKQQVVESVCPKCIETVCPKCIETVCPKCIETVCPKCIVEKAKPCINTKDSTVSIAITDKNVEYIQNLPITYKSMAKDLDLFPIRDFGTKFRGATTHNREGFSFDNAYYHFVRNTKKGHVGTLDEDSSLGGGVITRLWLVGLLRGFINDKATEIVISVDGKEVFETSVYNFCQRIVYPAVFPLHQYRECLSTVSERSIKPSETFQGCFSTLAIPFQQNYTIHLRNKDYPFTSKNIRGYYYATDVKINTLLDKNSKNFPKDYDKRELQLDRESLDDLILIENKAFSRLIPTLTEKYLENFDNEVLDKENEQTNFTIEYPIGKAGIVTKLEIDLDSNKFKDWNETILQIYWDYTDSPQVDIPLSYLFGLVYGYDSETLLKLKTDNVIRAHGFGFYQMGKGGGYLSFPMPFKDGFKLKLINYASKVKLLKFKVSINLKYIYDSSNYDVGYFHTQLNHQDYDDILHPITILDTYTDDNNGLNVDSEENDHNHDVYGNLTNIYHSSFGKLCMFILRIEQRMHNIQMLSVYPNRPPRTNLSMGYEGYEGDLKIYDNEKLRDPSHQGTGVEELFNFAHGLPRIRQSFASYGSLLTSELIQHVYDTFHAYRIFKRADAINWENGIKIQIDKGDGMYLNRLPLKSYSVAMYYKGIVKNVRCLQIDLFTLYNDTEPIYPYSQEKSFSTNAKLKTAMKNLLYYGQRIYTPEISISGGFQAQQNLIIQRKAFTQFTVKIPKANKLLQIIRLFDYRYCNQQAEIFIDDIFAGVWYNAGCNYYFPLKEDDFFVSPTLTRNKERVTVKIVPSYRKGLDVKPNDYLLKLKPEFPAGNQEWYRKAHEMNITQSWTEYQYKVIAQVLLIYFCLLITIIKLNIIFLSKSTRPTRKKCNII